jgi:hypothetical protein
MTSFADLLLLIGTWASLDGPIGFRGFLEFPNRIGALWRVQDVQLSYAMDDTFGAVTGGYLDLKGYLTPAHLTWSDANSNCKAILKPASSRNESPTYTTQAYVDLDSDAKVSNSETEVSSFFCMLGWFYFQHKDLGMMLLKLVDRDQGLFQRLGIAIMDLDMDRDGKILVDLLSVLKEQSLLPCRSHSEGLYTIRII